MRFCTILNSQTVIQIHRILIRNRGDMTNKHETLFGGVNALKHDKKFA